jgi:hypothetical protein
MTRTQALILGAATLLLTTACSRPRFEGPQVQSPPPRFQFDPNSSQARNVFGERLKVRQVAWWRFGKNDTGSTIFITTYHGPSTRDAAQSALDTAEEKWGRPTHEYGGLELLRIDDQTAWGWLETSTRSNGALRGVDYTAVIPYDSVTYVVEFSTDEEELLLPDSLRAIVRTFAVGRTEIDAGGMALAGVAALVLLLVIGGRLKAKADMSVGPQSRASQMRLAKIPAREEAETSQEAEETDPEALPPP